MLQVLLNKSFEQPPQNSNCADSNQPSQKLSSLDKQNMVEKQDELISDSIQWTFTHGRANVGQAASTYLSALVEYWL